MCLPAVPAIAVAGLALTAGTAALGAFSSYQQAQSNNKATEWNAKLLERNADIENIKARDAIERGKVAENEQRQKVKQFASSQKAAFSSSGLLADEGTNLDIIKDTAGFGELDALTIRRNAGVEAWSFNNQAEDLKAQASLTRMRKTNPLLAAGGSLITGGSQLASQLYSYKDVFKGRT